MKTTRRVSALLAAMLLVLVASLGCGRAKNDRVRETLPEAPRVTSAQPQVHTAKMPVKNEVDDSHLPLDITVDAPEVPSRIREPSPPIQQNAAK